MDEERARKIQSLIFSEDDQIVDGGKMARTPSWELEGEGITITVYRGIAEDRGNRYVFYKMGDEELLFEHIR